jgi:urocanate hydratase
MSQREYSLQERVLRTFTTLQLLRPDWGGALILCCGLGPDGAALAVASNIAGAVYLGIEDDPAALKAAIRSGTCDFIVSTLDEALRTIKNEVRKKSPLSVGLQGDPGEVLAETVERGVSPQLFTDPTGDYRSSGAQDAFRALGAFIVDLRGDAAGSDVIDSGAILEAFLQQQRWQLETYHFASSMGLREFDARASSLLKGDDQLRRQWLNAAPKILHRERPLHRALWLTDEEKAALAVESSA